MFLFDPKAGAQPTEIRAKQTDEVRAVIQLSDGRLASGGLDGTVRVWSPESVTSDAVYNGHSSPVAELVEFADGRIVSRSRDELHVWHPDNPSATMARYPASEGLITGIAKLADDRLAVSTWSTLSVWDPKNADETPIFSPAEGKRISMLQSMVDGRVLVRDNDGLLYAWDASSPDDLTEISTVDGRWGSLPQLDDGKLVILGKTMTLLDPLTLEETAIGPWFVEPKQTGDGRRDGWSGVAAHLSESNLAVADTDGFVWLVDVNDPAGREPLLGANAWDMVQLDDGRIAVAGAGVHIYGPLS